MTQAELEKRQTRAQNETLVISRTDDGFRVYDPAEPSKSYIVSGSPEHPSCTCPDFQYHDGQGDWRCKHILAVLERYSSDSCVPQTGQERGAIQGARSNGASTNGKRHPQMLI